MSMQGLIQFRGSTVTIKRATNSETANGTFKTAWSDVVVGTKALIEAVTSDLAQRQWGQETAATHRAYMAYDTDVKVGDGMIVTAGAHETDRYRIATVLPRDMSAASKYLEVGLESTPESF